MSKKKPTPTPPVSATTPPNYRTCAHVESLGDFAVYVKPSCPRASMVMGRLVSSKKRCVECRVWRARETDGR